MLDCRILPSIMALRFPLPLLLSFSFLGILPWAAVPVVLSREITFPSLAAAVVHPNGQSFQKPFMVGDDDIAGEVGGAGTGLTTYANLPYVNCMSSENGNVDVDVEKYDIAVLGAPFDTVS